jgi:two-component system, OmpR family, sensor histidine kinase KdpD
MKKLVGDLLLSAATVAAISGGIAAVLSRWQVGPLAVVYILGILWLATRGRTAALLAAIEAFLVYDWFFVPPFHTLDVQQPQEWLELGIFLVVALVAGQAYALQRRQALEAAERDRHTQLLYDLSTGLTVQENLGGMFDRMLAKLAQGLGLSGLRLYVWREGARELSGGVEVASDGVSEPVTSVYRVPCRIGERDLAEMEIFQRWDGQPLSQDDLRVLQGFANQLANALERRRLEKEEQLNQVLGEANRAKSSLLAAVSHDLRTPLASIKAAASSLQDKDVDWPPEATDELMDTIVEETDRLITLVANLLDMSRLQTGAVNLNMGKVGLEDVTHAALASLSRDASQVSVDIPSTLPAVQADPALLERAVANLIDNALNWSALDQPVRVEAGMGGERVYLRVVDRGPGIPADQRESVFEPFRRLGGGVNANWQGVGLGLAVAKGFVEAMGGELNLDDTPGRGVTAVISLAVADREHLAGAATDTDSVARP